MTHWVSDKNCCFPFSCSDILCKVFSRLTSRLRRIKKMQPWGFSKTQCVLAAFFFLQGHRRLFVGTLVSTEGWSVVFIPSPWQMPIFHTFLTVNCSPATGFPAQDMDIFGGWWLSQVKRMNPWRGRLIESPLKLVKFSVCLLVCFWNGAYYVA